MECDDPEVSCDKCYFMFIITCPGPRSIISSTSPVLLQAEPLYQSITADLRALNQSAHSFREIQQIQG